MSRTLPAVAVLLVATACTALDGDNTVTISSAEFGPELQSLQEAFDAFTERTGIVVDVQGSPNFEAEIGRRVRSGDPPDIAIFPQPGAVHDFADAIPALPDDVAATVLDSFDPGFTDLVTVDGELKAIPAKADLKSLVWYRPEVFDNAGYEPPETFDGFLALIDQMAADGNTPLCVGIEAGDSSGWPMTDWIEDFLLRMHGPELYDQWYRHEIPFDHPAVVEVAQAVADLWSRRGIVYGGTDAAAVTGFADAGLPLLGGECMMHRQSNFYAALWPDGTELGSGGDIDAFHLPGSEENPDVTLVGGNYATAFSDHENVVQVMEFIASTEFANARASDEIGGFLSPNKHVATSSYPDELTQRFAEILADARPVRFDASDLMPGIVGSGTFWAVTVDITLGVKDVATAFADVEETWPD